MAFGSSVWCAPGELTYRHAAKARGGRALGVKGRMADARTEDSEADDSQTLLGREVRLDPDVERIVQTLELPVVSLDDSYQRVEVAVLFTDLVGSTAYFEKHGDAAGMALIEQHNELLFPIVEANAGRVIKTIGDAIMAAFECPGDAATAAVQMQRRLKAYNEGAPHHARILIRIGINAGTAIEREGDLFGDVVNAAARVEGLASGGQVLISERACMALPAPFDVPVFLFDAVMVKGKSLPIEVFEIRWDPDAVERVGPPPTFDIGAVLGGRFELLELLGQGGMGQVYRARDHVLDDEVALKFIRPRLVDQPGALEQFKQEVRLTRSLTSAGICRIHEFLEMEGHHFLSMEIIGGRTLRGFVEDEGPLDAATVRQVLVGMASGLAAAHARGIVHRDLKPANVMIEGHLDRVVLMDFGLAEIAALSSDGGRVAGTPEYMSPEQARGDAVTPAADVYALGVMLYELLAGVLPFKGNGAIATTMLHLTGQARPLEEIAPSAPTDLVELARRCMAKDPTERPPDAQAVLDWVRPATPTHRARRWPLVLLAATLGFGGTYAAWHLSTHPDAPSVSSQAGSPAHYKARVLVSGRGVERAARYAPDGGVVFIRDGDLWRQSAAGGLRRLTQGRHAAGAETARGVAFRGGKLLFSGRDAAGVFEVADGVETLAFPGASMVDAARDGRVAFVESRGITVAGDGGSTRVLENTRSQTYTHPRFSPDGKKLALVVHHHGYRSTRDIAVLDLESRALTPLTKDGLLRAYNTEPAWASDGRSVVYASKRSGRMALYRVPVQGGPSEPLTHGATRSQRAPDVSADGARVLFSTEIENYDIGRVSLDSGQAELMTEDAWANRFPVYSPSGRRVAYRAQRAEDAAYRVFVVVERETGEQRTFDPGPGARDFTFCGEDALIYASTRGKDRFLEWIDFEGKRRVLVSDLSRVWWPHCDADGTTVVFTGVEGSGPRRTYVLDPTRTGARPTQLLSASGDMTWAAVSSDGKQVAYRWSPDRTRIGDSELRVMVRETGEVRVRPTPEAWRNSARRLRFDPSGLGIYFVEEHGEDGQLWRVDPEGRAARIAMLPQIHTFDFDLAPGGDALIYPRVRRRGDLYELVREAF